jgi:hypothetical protein
MLSDSTLVIANSVLKSRYSMLTREKRLIPTDLVLMLVLLSKRLMLTATRTFIIQKFSFSDIYLIIFNVSMLTRK